MAYETLYRSKNEVDGVVAATNVDKDGQPVYEFQDREAGNFKKGTTKLVSNAPDFTSILKVEDEIYSITQFEWRNPGVAYLSELEQNATTGKLTVCCRVLVLVLSCLLLAAHLRPMKTVYVIA